MDGFHGHADAGALHESAQVPLDRPNRLGGAADLHQQGEPAVEADHAHRLNLGLAVGDVMADVVQDARVIRAGNDEQGLAFGPVLLGGAGRRGRCALRIGLPACAGSWFWTGSGHAVALRGKSPR